ncbi:hypothetical protein BDR26DRAFT_1003777 [Obelidium mucronatum]|nr:hypothetical protein BDR26DRAFT_1003777 [Obelidium mucronatum]
MSLPNALISVAIAEPVSDNSNQDSTEHQKSPASNTKGIDSLAESSNANSNAPQDSSHAQEESKGKTLNSKPLSPAAVAAPSSESHLKPLTATLTAPPVKMGQVTAHNSATTTSAVPIIHNNLSNTVSMDISSNSSESDDMEDTASQESLNNDANEASTMGDQDLNEINSVKSPVASRKVTTTTITATTTTSKTSLVLNTTTKLSGEISAKHISKAASLVEPNSVLSIPPPPSITAPTTFTTKTPHSSPTSENIQPGNLPTSSSLNFPTENNNNGSVSFSLENQSHQNPAILYTAIAFGLLLFFGIAFLTVYLLNRKHKRQQQGQQRHLRDTWTPVIPPTKPDYYNHLFPSATMKSAAVVENHPDESVLSLTSTKRYGVVVTGTEGGAGANSCGGYNSLERVTTALHSNKRNKGIENVGALSEEPKTRWFDKLRRTRDRRNHDAKTNDSTNGGGIMRGTIGEVDLQWTERFSFYKRNSDLYTVDEVAVAGEFPAENSNSREHLVGAGAEAGVYGATTTSNRTSTEQGCEWGRHGTVVGGNERVQKSRGLHKSVWGNSGGGAIGNWPATRVRRSGVVVRDTSVAVQDAGIVNGQRRRGVLPSSAGNGAIEEKSEITDDIARNQSNGHSTITSSCDCGYLIHHSHNDANEHGFAIKQSKLSGIVSLGFDKSIWPAMQRPHYWASTAARRRAEEDNVSDTSSLKSEAESWNNELCQEGKGYTQFTGNDRPLYTPTECSTEK